MDYQPCQPCHPASYTAHGIVRPRRNAIVRVCVIGLMTSILVLLVYGVISAHLRTERRVVNLQSELHLINRELSRMIDRYGDQQPPHHHTTNRAAMEQSPDNSSLQMNQLEALVRQHTATLQKELAHTSGELHRLRSGVESMKVGAALGHGGDVGQPHHHLDRMDYALESIGGSVEHTGASRLPNSFLAILTRTLSLNAPRRIIQPTMAIGECFGFYGNDGEVVVRLQQRVFVEAVSIDHIRSEMAPRGSVNSAPKEFAVYGVADEATGKEDFLGTYEYKIVAVRPLQVFEIAESLRSKNSHALVRFKFMSNHGNEEYTCVYQVKVHGRPDDGGVRHVH